MGAETSTLFLPCEELTEAQWEALETQLGALRFRSLVDFPLRFCILAFYGNLEKRPFFGGIPTLRPLRRLWLNDNDSSEAYVNCHVKTRPWKNAQLCTWSPKALSQSEPALCAPRPSWLEFRNFWDLERCHGATFIFYIVFFCSFSLHGNMNLCETFIEGYFKFFHTFRKVGYFGSTVYRFSFWGSWDSCWRPKVWGWISSVVRNLQTGNLISAGTLKIVTWRLIEGIFF